MRFELYFINSDLDVVNFFFKCGDTIALFSHWEYSDNHAQECDDDILIELHGQNLKIIHGPKLDFTSSDYETMLTLIRTYYTDAESVYDFNDHVREQVISGIPY